MKIELSFEEIEKIVKEKSDYDVSLSYESDYTIRLEMDMEVPLSTVHIDVLLTIESIKNNNIYISYSFPSNMMGMAFKLFRKKVIGKIPMVYEQEGENLVVSFNHNIKLKNIRNKIDINDIWFDGDNMIAELKLL